MSPDGRVALIRIHYPPLEELDRSVLDDLKELGRRARERLPLRVEMGGDLFFAFEEAETGPGEILGLRPRPSSCCWRSAR